MNIMITCLPTNPITDFQAWRAYIKMLADVQRLENNNEGFENFVNTFINSVDKVIHLRNALDELLK